MFVKIKAMQKTHSLNSWLNLIFSSATVALVFISVVINLLATPTEIVEEVGVKTFRMFTAFPKAVHKQAPELIACIGRYWVEEIAEK